MTLPKDLTEMTWLVGDLIKEIFGYYIESRYGNEAYLYTWYFDRKCRTIIVEIGFLFKLKGIKIVLEKSNFEELVEDYENFLAPRGYGETKEKSTKKIAVLELLR